MPTCPHLLTHLSSGPLCDWTMQVQTRRISPGLGSSCHTRPHTRAVFNSNIFHLLFLLRYTFLNTSVHFFSFFQGFYPFMLFCCLSALAFLFSQTLNNNNRMCWNVYEADLLRLTTVTRWLYISLAAHKRCSALSVSLGAVDFTSSVQVFLIFLSFLSENIFN